MPYLSLFTSAEAQAKSRPRGYYDNEVSKSTGAYERVVYDNPTEQAGATEFFFLWGFSRLFADGFWVGSNFDLAAEGFRFQSEHEDLFRRTGSMANIALHYSRQTRDFYGGLADSYHVDEWRGWAMLLLQENIPFDVVLDEDLAEPIPSRIGLLILPNSACLSDTQVEEVRRFVRRGRRVIATADTSLYTGEGDRRPDFALGRVLGVRHGATIRGAAGRATWDDESGRRRTKVRDDVTLVEPTEGAKAIGKLTGLGADGPAGVTGPSGRTVYIAAKAGLLGGPQRPAKADDGKARWLGPREPGWHEMALATVRALLPRGTDVQLVNAPRGLIMSASRNGARIVVQVLNGTGGVRGPGETFDPDECVFPPIVSDAEGPMRLWLRTNRPSSVRLLSPDLDEELTLSPEGAREGWQVSLPAGPLQRYAMVVWEADASPSGS